MDTSIFWEIIGQYNSETIIIQILLFVSLIIAYILSYVGKIRWLIKFVLGIITLFIGIVFFGHYGTERIQKYFALPLFIFCGLLFIYDSYKNRQSEIEKLNKWQIALLFLYLMYPFTSYFFGNKFPIMTTYIMPCPVISVSIIIYAGYKIKNKLLLLLMAIWGLTGVKAFIANAYEDIILLICGIYCIFVLVKQLKQKKII